MLESIGRRLSIGRGPLKPAADTSDTADTHQKLILKKKKLCGGYAKRIDLLVEEALINGHPVVQCLPSQ